MLAGVGDRARCDIAGTRDKAGMILAGDGRDGRRAQGRARWWAGLDASVLEAEPWLGAVGRRRREVEEERKKYYDLTCGPYVLGDIIGNLLEGSPPIV